jgi:hypothetical protein
VSKFLDLLKESAEILESNEFPEIQKYEDLGRVLTVGEHKKLTQVVLKAVAKITHGTAIYDEYENAFEDLKNQYPVLRAYTSQSIDDLWEMYMSLDESKEQVVSEANDQQDFFQSIKNELKNAQKEIHASRDRVEGFKKEFKYSDLGAPAVLAQIKVVSGFLGDLGGACGLLADEEYHASVSELESAIEIVTKHADLDVETVESKMEKEVQKVRTEEIDPEVLEDGAKQKEIVQVMATAIAVGLAQVENIVGENFENAREAEKFFWSLARMMRTGSASGDLKASLRRFDRIGGEKVLSTFRRELARV